MSEDLQSCRPAQLTVQRCLLLLLQVKHPLSAEIVRAVCPAAASAKEGVNTDRMLDESRLGMEETGRTAALPAGEPAWLCAGAAGGMVVARAADGAVSALLAGRGLTHDGCWLLASLG